MAALVQSFPQQSSTVTMLQTRPSSASGILQTQQNQPHIQYPVNNSQGNRNSYHGMNNGQAVSNYRGQTSMAPIAPYAFTSTPALGQRAQGGPHLRADQRTSSAPQIPTFQQGDRGHAVPRTRYPADASVSTSSTSSSSDLSSLGHHSGSKDDFSLASTARIATRAPRPHSTIITSSSGILAPPSLSSPVKASPDRYRRPANRRADSSTNSQQSSPQPPSLANMPNVQNFYGNSVQQAQQSESLQGLNLQIPQSRNLGKDDTQFNRSQPEQAKRYRRRSIHTIDAQDYTHYKADPLITSAPTQGHRQVHSSPGPIRTEQLRYPVDPLRSSPIISVRPTTSHGRNGSSDSVNSTRSSSRPSSASKREASVSMATSNPAPSSLNASVVAETTPLKVDQPRLVNIPPRASSSDAAKRIANPSPLSKPMTMNTESSTSKDSFASAVNAALQPSTKSTTNAQAATNSGSPAAQQLAALNEKDGKKSKSSRLRRAFSFGSAAELRKASAENSAANNAASAAGVDRSKLRKDRYQEEQDAEQARIAAQQEAGGIGSGIYSGQGNFFTGSTDNLSISSTASSASIMIRKMGKGMKKSTRSLVGLFRPKSVIGVPAADAALPEVSQAQVSMVTVEAEREKVNVNVNPHEQSGGGTGYPRLERNSIDAVAAGQQIQDRLGSSSTENSGARRSIVGGEKERAEVLAAVKKGILKRSGTDSASSNSSPVVRPSDNKTPNFHLPQIPNVNDSPNSSAPSTPNDDQQGHRRTGSVTLGGEDYFMSALRFRGDSKSVPSTPQGAILKRNATFSPRIQFHDTWPSGEYDRRGEIATCNRLTPMLAQQIKEELNTFKMEMEVHENSKIYTHFF